MRDQGFAVAPGTHTLVGIKRFEVKFLFYPTFKLFKYKLKTYWIPSGNVTHVSVKRNEVNYLGLSIHYIKLFFQQMLEIF